MKRVGDEMAQTLQALLTASDKRLNKTASDEDGSGDLKPLDWDTAPAMSGHESAPEYPEVADPTSFKDPEEFFELGSDEGETFTEDEMRLLVSSDPEYIMSLIESDRASKKASVMADVVNTLVKLANDLDDDGDAGASSLVDEALRVIVQKMDDSLVQ